MSTKKGKGKQVVVNNNRERENRKKIWVEVSPRRREKLGKGELADLHRGLIRPQRPELGIRERGKEMRGRKRDTASRTSPPASREGKAGGGSGAQEESKGWVRQRKRQNGPNVKSQARQMEKAGD